MCGDVNACMRARMYANMHACRQLFLKLRVHVHTITHARMRAYALARLHGAYTPVHLHACPPVLLVRQKVNWPARKVNWAAKKVFFFFGRSSER